MTLPEIAALVAAAVLAGVILLQALLAAGFPLGRAAWGGEHRVLPPRLRLGSVAAVFMLAVAGWVVLARAGLVRPGPEPVSVHAATWVSAVFFALNAVGNASSRSRVERWVMTPLATVLALCFAVVGLFAP